MPPCRLPSSTSPSAASPPGPATPCSTCPAQVWGTRRSSSDDADPPAGSGIARTGVTVVDPGGDVWASPVPAGVAVLNGAGELTGSLQIREWGVIETPVFLTSTMQVGRVYDAACRMLMAEQPEIEDSVVIPVVGECDDSWLNDPRTMHVTDAHVAEALSQARLSAKGDLPADGRSALSGCVGAGTGTVCMGWKGGIGTSSRVLPDGTTVAVVLLTNFGAPHQLTIRGRVVGAELDEPAWWAEHHPEPAGSCIGVVVTDAPLDPATAGRVAARVGLGLARCGSVAHHGSGEIFCCLATGLRAPRGADARARRLARVAPGRPLRGHGRCDRVRCVGQPPGGNHDHGAAGPYRARCACRPARRPARVDLTEGLGRGSTPARARPRIDPRAGKAADRPPRWARPRGWRLFTRLEKTRVRSPTSWSFSNLACVLQPRGRSPTSLGGVAQPEKPPTTRQSASRRPGARPTRPAPGGLCPGTAGPPRPPRRPAVRDTVDGIGSRPESPSDRGARR